MNHHPSLTLGRGCLMKRMLVACLILCLGCLRTDSAEILQLGIDDGKLDGILIGTGAAGEIAAGTLGTLLSNEGNEGRGALFVAGGLGLGAFMGLAMDASHKGDRLLYRAR